jgi:beta-glucosidase
MAPLTKSGIFAVLLALSHSISAQNTSWDHSLFTSSPPVYPSRECDALVSNVMTPLTPQIAPSVGDGWKTAFSQADAFVASLTLEEKVTLLTGVPQGPCIGKDKSAKLYRR